MREFIPCDPWVTNCSKKNGKRSSVIIKVILYPALVKLTRSIH